MNILLISPNTHAVPYPVYPLGLDYVAGALADRHEVRIVDLNVVERAELAEIIQKFRPDIIGISIRNIDNTEVSESLFFVDSQEELVGWLRSRTDGVIVLGGAGFTILAREIFSRVRPDYGIVGEGERFALLVAALEEGRAVDDIPGLISSVKVLEPVPLEGGRPLSASPGSHADFYLRRGGMLNLQSKRGCSFSCIYCPYPHIEGHRHRLVDPDQVAETALRLQDKGARYFFITDSAFNSDVRHSMQVARSFRRHGLSIPWGGFFAPIRMPEDYFHVMKECGLSHVEFGTESLSDTMLHTYRKPFRAEDVFAAHRQAVAAGLHVAHYFLLGGPGESSATLESTLSRVEQLQRTVSFFFTGIRVYPYTSLYDIAVAEGKISEETSLLEPYYYESDAISHREIEALVSARAGQRINWIVGSGGTKAAKTVASMHERGYNGPLWEYLIR